MKKILIPDCPGELHNKAAQKFLGKKIMILPCNTICEMFNFTENNPDIDGAVMRIENSFTGSVLQNYKLLQKSKLKVTGEMYLAAENNNYNRFFILQRDNIHGSEVNKASLYFEVDHHSSSIVLFFTVFARCGITLSKLQSVYIPDRIWAFAFYADIEFNSVFDFNNAIERMKPVAENIHIYGVYKRGQQPVF